MVVNQQTLNDLTLNTLYTVKWAVFGRVPDYIKVTAIASGNATVQFYDITGTILQDTRTLLASATVFVIDSTI